MEGVHHPWRGAFLILAAITCGFLILPIFITLPVSLTPTRYISMPTGEISWRHYQEILTDPAWRSAFADSFLVGIGSAFLALVLGTGAAIGLWRSTGFSVHAVRAVIRSYISTGSLPTKRCLPLYVPIMPMAVPSSPSAAACCICWSH